MNSSGFASMNSLFSLMSVQNDSRPVFVNPGARYICPVCRHVLHNPFQTACGHRLCESCIDDLLSKQDPAPCPVGEDTCTNISRKDNMIFKDMCARREVANLVVFCTYKQHGCEKQTQWKELKKHIEQCKFAPRECPNSIYGCLFAGPEQQLLKHIEDGCDYRQERCTWCGQTVSQLQYHKKNICLKAEVSCPNGCGEKNIQREKLEDHKINCSLRLVDCSFSGMGCQFKCPLHDMSAHISTAVQHHMELQARYLMTVELENAKLKHDMQDIDNENDIMKQKLLKLSDDKSELENRIKQLERQNIELQERVSHVEDSVKMTAKSEQVFQNTVKIGTIEESHHKLQHRINLIENSDRKPTPATSDSVVKEMRSLSQQIGIQDVRLAETDLRFQIMETATYNGKMLWKIRDIGRRKKDADTGKTLSLYSQPFYTSRHGYKMCARIYLNGDGMGKNSHMSLFFVIMRGEYDALLTWPFRQKVTLTLIDQDQGRRHLSESFRPDVTSSSFKRPSSDMNVASGCPCFVEQSVMLSPTYCKDNTIFIKVTVDTNNLTDP